MNHRNTRLLLSLAVLSALAACGGQESKEQKPASAPTEASAVQTTPDAASTASAASQAAVDSNASPEDQELLKRAQGIFKPLPSAEDVEINSVVYTFGFCLKTRLSSYPALSRMSIDTGNPLCS